MLSNTSSFVSLLSCCLVVAACGGDPLDPGAGDDPGGGTNTLFVEGRVSAESSIANSQRSTDFRTDFSIRVLLNDTPVTTGTVTITSRNANTPLAYNAGENRWEGTAPGYDEVYQLDVTSGEDTVEGVIVDGPDLHTITAPAAGASIDSTIANELTWDSSEVADVATFRTKEIDRIQISDTGTYSIAPGGFKAEKDKAREDEIELRRMNHVAPRGAVAGSDFAVSLEQRIDVIVLANPAL